MMFKLLQRLRKTAAISLLLLGFIGTEPILHSAVYSSTSSQEHLKILMDTRAQVTLKYNQRILADKQRIFRALDQVAVGLTPEDKQQLAEFIYKESREQEIDPRLIVAVIKTESEFRRKARSRAGAHGLMQVRLPTAQECAREMGIKWQGRNSLYKAHLNIRMGTYYLGKMVQRFENLELALTAYNMGPTALRKRMIAKNHVPKKYSRKVLNIYRQL